MCVNYNIIGTILDSISVFLHQVQVILLYSLTNLTTHLLHTCMLKKERKPSLSNTVVPRNIHKHRRDEVYFIAQGKLWSKQVCFSLAW